jgi:hypothetical protein
MLLAAIAELGKAGTGDVLGLRHQNPEHGTDGLRPEEHRLLPAAGM